MKMFDHSTAPASSIKQACSLNGYFGVLGGNLPPCALHSGVLTPRAPLLLAMHETYLLPRAAALHDSEGSDFLSRPRRRGSQ